METHNENKRGRKLGNKVCRNVEISELNKRFSETATIPVSKAFLDMVGIEYEANGEGLNS